MKILIIDSHKGSQHTIPENMHWQNAKILADELGADLIWSYPTVNDNIKRGYDVIIFVHASHYAFTDYKWLEDSPDAKLFYITNEYNLGEPRTLWMAAKAGRKYHVIANHPHEPSKVVMKYVTDWTIVNINAMVYAPKSRPEGISEERSGCVYYGSFRKGRSKYFAKYLDKNVLLSTHSKNIDKFRDAGATSEITKRIVWRKEGLWNYKNSLYLEDEITHTHYNFLANRFYEALNYDCVPVFGEECRRSIELSGYDIKERHIISDSSQLNRKWRELNKIERSWHDKAQKERENSIQEIKAIIQMEI